MSLTGVDSFKTKVFFFFKKKGYSLVLRRVLTALNSTEGCILQRDTGIVIVSRQAEDLGKRFVLRAIRNLDLRNSIIRLVRR